MRGFLQFITLAALSVVSTATPTMPSSVCPGATLVTTTEVPIGSNTLTYAQFECELVEAVTDTIIVSLNPILCILLGIDCPPPPPPYIPRPPSPKSECGASCSVSCNNNTAGTLPPVSSDCQAIQDSFTILQQQLTSSTFTVESGHVETLSFGTCQIFFQNLSPETLEYCWSDLATVSANAGNECFPPNAFSFGEGLCTGYDSFWAVGEAHS